MRSFTYITGIATAIGLAVAGLPAAAATTPDWKTCAGRGMPAGMQCSTIDVPVDWAAPGGRKITLRIGRLPATDPSHRIGTVLAVPGGPAASGVDALAASAKNYQNTRKRFDIVSLDPRWNPPESPDIPGPLPITCWTGGVVVSQPNGPAEYAKQGATNRRSAQECRRHDPEFFDHLDSKSVARDLEAIRIALGEPKVNMIATSYGGVPATTYATLFPQRVRALVLDGAVDHTADPATIDREVYPLIERQFSRFVQWCGENTQCALHGKDVKTVWRKLLAGADRKPVPVVGHEPVAYSGFDMVQVASLYAQNSDGWPDLARMIDKALHGDASGFIADLPPGSTDLKPLAAPATYTVMCPDGYGVRDYAEYRQSRARGARLAPDMPGAFLRDPLACVGWPNRIVNPRTPLTHVTLPAVLGLGAWRDHTGPEHIVSEVPGSVSVLYDHDGHGMYDSGVTCMIAYGDRYLIDGTLPPKGTVCKP
ncbi:alpha/beta fold hydrolase [Fodinicola acaciae]|uniref:alpha/beta fold hydrolase n=1 Tax=Fodinicola acaciae TaxID=2681555 RepID=UPI0013D765E8|nr:alpha/beta fold hydrolase [Fodinicola acaciae]